MNVFLAEYKHSSDSNKTLLEKYFSYAIYEFLDSSKEKGKTSLGKYKRKDLEKISKEISYEDRSKTKKFILKLIKEENEEFIRKIYHHLILSGYGREEEIEY